MLSDVVVLLLRLLIKLDWSWWWETTGQGRHGAEFLTVRSRSRSQWPMGRECLIGAPGPTQTQATTSRESQASICFVSVANNHYWSFSDKVILVYSLRLVRMHAQSSKSIVNFISLINLWKRPICVKTEEWVGSIKRIWGDSLVVLLLFDSTEWIVFVDFLFLKMLLGWHFPN